MTMTGAVRGYRRAALLALWIAGAGLATGPVAAQTGLATEPPPRNPLTAATASAAAAIAPDPATPDLTPAVAQPQGPNLPKVPPQDPNRGAVTNLPLPRFVTLKTGEGNARRGPGLTHRIDWVFTRAGMPLKITAEYENWRRVEDADGVGGWVHYSLLSGVRSVIIEADTADLHARPDDTSEVVVRADRNVLGRIVECQPDWCRINIQGEKGWLPKSALWGVNSGEVIE
jgi:SH3-like domain-containing protein